MSLTPCNDAPLLHSIFSKIYANYHDFEKFMVDFSVENIASELLDGVFAWIWYVDEQAVGIVKTRCENAILYFWHLAIVPEFQGQGHAREIIKSLENMALEQGCQKIECKIQLPVPGFLRVYQDDGYELLSAQVTIKSAGYQKPEVVMRKCLLSEPEESEPKKIDE